MAENIFTNNPKFECGSLCLLFGQSRSGKSTWLTNLLLENEHHFDSKVKQLVYVYQEMDNNIKKLQSKFKKNGLFLNELPCDVESLLIPNHSVLVMDDLELQLRHKEKREVLLRLSMVTAHHRGIHVFFCFQSYGIFYKKSPLNKVLYQATSLVLFRSINTFGSLKRFLNGYDIKLKRGSTLYDIFKNYVQYEQYNYLLVNLSPSLPRAEVFSQILNCESRPLLIFHEE